MQTQRFPSQLMFMPHRVPYLLEVLVTVDVLLVVGVLQLVGLDVLPEGLDDAGPGLGVNAEQASQARVQLKLGRLRRPYIYIYVYV